MICYTVKGVEMKVQAINSNISSYANQQNPQFKGIWMRLGENYLDHSLYHSAAYFLFVNGKRNLAVDMYKGSPVQIFSSNEMTVEEGKAAYKFLFDKAQNNKGYEAAKKLFAFIKTFSTKDNTHNIMFLEKEDCADPMTERKKISYSLVNGKLHEYELAHKIIKEEVTPVKKEIKPLSREEFSALIRRNGVA